MTSLNVKSLPQEPSEAVTLGMQLAGKHMIFKLDAEEYGLEILAVREIMGVLEITRIPRTPDFIRGVINLRGKVIPVIDLRLKFGMERTEATENSVIIVVQFTDADLNITMGLLVDQVVEVLDIPPTEIEPTPTYGTNSINTNFILGVGKAEKRVIFLLDIGRILTAGETVVAMDIASQDSGALVETPSS